MPLQIYNSLTRKKEIFKPITPGVVTMYTCGVTVYDECHIGHARSLYIFDVLRKYLEYRGYTVNFVRNITDIDDKIIQRANETNIRWDTLVENYIGSYYQDLKALGIQPGALDGAQEPRATKNIEEIIHYIQGLIDKGYAYMTDTGVYFSVRKFEGYGKLSGQSIEQMVTGSRKEPDETKRDSLDFALWKSSKPNEPSWPSPWGDGRPGWHIECSVMSTKYLKALTLDIHAGGRDLIFPHHENELTQSEALTGEPFVNYWLHHGLLTINGQKMSKSLGNFITIKDFLKQEGNFIKLKLFFLSAHYHSPLDYTDEAMHSAAENAETFDIFFRKIKKYAHNVQPSAEADDFKERFCQAMNDDFNTPVALSVLFEMVSQGNKYLSQNNIAQALSIAKMLEGLLIVMNLNEIKEWAYGTVSPEEREEEVRGLDDLQREYKNEFEKYGISLVAVTNPGDVVENHRRLFDNFKTLRDEARQKRDFVLSDRIRDDFKRAIGIIIEDTKEGPACRPKKA